MFENNLAVVAPFQRIDCGRDFWRRLHERIGTSCSHVASNWRGGEKQSITKRGDWEDNYSMNHMRAFVHIVTTRSLLCRQCDNELKRLERTAYCISDVFVSELRFSKTEFKKYREHRMMIDYHYMFGCTSRFSRGSDTDDGAT